MSAPDDQESPRSTGPRERYAAVEARHAERLAELRAVVRRVETARLISFLVAAVVGLLYRDLPVAAAVPLTISGVVWVLFFVLVVRHRQLRRVVRRVEVGEALARIGQLRIWRQWDEMAELYEELGYVDPLLDPLREREESHAYIEDLDVFGPASVRALLGPTPTPTGSGTLRSWLVRPGSVAEIRLRQDAAAALADDFEGREALATEALLLDGVDARAWERFGEWLGEPPLLAAAEGTGLPTWAVHVARVLPVITLTLAGLDFGIGLDLPNWSWGAPLAVQAALAWRWGSVLHGYFQRAGSSSGGLRRYHALFRAWEEYEVDDTLVSEQRARLSGDGGMRASEEIRRLERWLDAADSRASMLHVVVAWGLLWDVHVAWGLERWRGRAGKHARGWYEAVGVLEAVTALATLAHDHPEWCRPVVHDGEPSFEAEDLGHPMLADSVRKTSPVTVDPPGRFLLVTGSNMSGKSTLLRSIGLAAVMAQAGAVVCARSARLSRLRTFTSMRIHDSVTEGVSLFMAELNRLKALVDEADADDGPALLYLVDEVLQGTNSDERRIAARRIVAHLLEARAIGAVTTHDLTLHEAPRLDRAATKVHFREHVGGSDGAAVLTFDYRLRPGLATSRNALKLLEIVGLGDLDSGEAGAG